MKILIGLILTFQSFALFAELDNPKDQIFTKQLPQDETRTGGWSSGGGNAVVCFSTFPDSLYYNDDGSLSDYAFNSGTIRSIEIFDLYEARIPRGIDQSEIPKIIDINNDENISSYILKVGDRYKNFVSPVSNIVTNGKKFIPDTNVRFYNGAVTQNRDYNPAIVIDSLKCIVTTIANQHNNNGFFELFIDARAFNHPTHSKLSKATLILHEYIYALARNLGQTDSHSARKIVEILITQNHNFSARQVTSLLRDLELVDLSTPYLDMIDLFHKPAQLFSAIAVKTGLFYQGYQDAGTYNLAHLLNTRAQQLQMQCSPINEDPTVIQLSLWWRNCYFKHTGKEYTGPSDVEDYLLNSCLSRLKSVESELFWKLQIFSNSLLDEYLNVISGMPGSSNDKEYLKMALNSSVGNLDDLAKTFILTEEDGLQNALILYTQKNLEEIQKEFIQEHSLEAILELNHTIDQY